MGSSGPSWAIHLGRDGVAVGAYTVSCDDSGSPAYSVVCGSCERRSQVWLS